MAEYFYSKGLQETKIGNRIDDFRTANAFYPYDYLFRSASALQLAKIGIEEKTEGFMNAAIAELTAALQKDPYSPKLLQAMYILKYNTNEFEEAKMYYNRLKQVSKKTSF